MSAQVTHQPRVAWDAARTFISFACSDSDAFAQFELLVDDVLGPRFREALVDSRSRLIGRSDTLLLVELGTWRVRFDDLLRSTPELTEALRVLAAT
jgi:hypothetical protein